MLDGKRVVESPGRELDHYFEAQVRGGVSLADDVDAIVTEPSFRGTTVEADLTRAATRYGFDLKWHGGSVLRVEDVPPDFRGATTPALARRVAARAGVVDARSIGIAASNIDETPPRPNGRTEDSPAQQLKYLWHTLLAHGTDAEARQLILPNTRLRRWHGLVREAAVETGNDIPPTIHRTREATAKERCQDGSGDVSS